MSSSAVDVDKSPFGDGDVFVDSDDGDVDGVRDGQDVTGGEEWN